METTTVTPLGLTYINIKKTVTFKELCLVVEHITETLLYHKLHFTLMHKPESKQVKIVSVSDCDYVKHLFIEQFEIEVDDRMKRYAVCTIQYE